MANNNAVIYTKTNIGGLFFDCYVSFSHNSELEITSHQVETGANISDHSYVKPKTLVVEVMMSELLRLIRLTMLKVVLLVLMKL